MSYKLADVIWNDDGTMTTKELSPLEVTRLLKDFILKCDTDSSSDLDNIYIRRSFDIIESTLKNYEELTSKPVILCERTHGYTQALIDTICKNYKEVKITNLEDEKKLKALEIIKVLFNGRTKLYERNDGIQQVIDRNGNYNKITTSVYILDFYVGDLHYEFHLHKEEFDLLKEVLL